MNELGWIIRASFGNRYFCQQSPIGSAPCGSQGGETQPRVGEMQDDRAITRVTLFSPCRPGIPHCFALFTANTGGRWAVLENPRRHIEIAGGGEGACLEGWCGGVFGGVEGLTALRPLNPPHCEYDPLSDFPIRSPAPASQQVIKFFQFTYFSNCC